jgi:hypothetical protein
MDASEASDDVNALSFIMACQPTVRMTGNKGDGSRGGGRREGGDGYNGDRRIDVVTIVWVESLRKVLRRLVEVSVGFYGHMKIGTAQRQTTGPDRRKTANDRPRCSETTIASASGSTR